LILRELLAKDGALNRVIELVEVFNESNLNPIIVMPRYVSATTIYPDDAACLVYGVQLVDAVDFLHQNIICHLDINSSNVVIDSPTKTLWLIDFGLAVRIKGPNETLRGSRGTPGKVAPELGLSCFPPEGGFSLRPSEIVPDENVTFNPVLVDIYAVGYTILSWIGYQPSGELKLLSDVACALEVDEPSQRMPLQEAKKRLSSIERPRPKAVVATKPSNSASLLFHIPIRTLLSML
jgi:serine/threonine protein kinase